MVAGWRQLAEPRVAKNRVHVDLVADDRDKEIDRLIELGATRQADHDEHGLSWTVMTDPEGNEFYLTDASAHWRRESRRAVELGVGRSTQGARRG